ncbi:hypothetical protein ACKENY_11775, partial [Acinetobacter baumannii]
IVVDEYSPSDIKEKLQSSTKVSFNKYSKYENDITWEDQEDKLIDSIKKVL